ncbi:uncharacterized protein LOC130817725 [Amaranthus tricolor]|uniref:uncharacterized protein LOC130817725 n=1 Tax=Amaranthus tricolor TaxID=29722 RepID=UPI002586C1B2|nr:uncharacterized protein LOC130817725 [Amaranthus tricolor]
MQAKSVVDDEVVASYKQACTQATVPHSGNSIKSQTICKITIDDIAEEHNHVKLPQHNVKYWGESTLRKIVGYLGRPLKIDTATLKIERMWYAQVLVDMDINEGFPEELYYTNEHDELVTQLVQYEWIPLWCSKCSQFGHMNTECRVGIKQTKSYANLAVDEDGFRSVKTRLVHKSKETPKENGEQLNAINPGLIEQETHVDGVSSKKSETALCSYADNTTIHKGRVNRKPSIGTKCDTINISNGLNKASKQDEVARFISCHNISLFGLPKTKVKRNGLGRFHQNICLGWCFTHNPDWHRGRIVVAWKSEEVKVDILTYHSQYIHLQVSPTVGSNFLCTLVYGATDKNTRSELLNHLEDIRKQISKPWIILGDFNCIANLNERIGTIPRLTETIPLRHCMDLWII